MKTEETTGQCDIRLKIVFLGDIGVGKTSIIERFVKDSFDPENYVAIQLSSQQSALISYPKIFPTITNSIDFSYGILRDNRNTKV